MMWILCSGCKELSPAPMVPHVCRCGTLNTEVYDGPPLTPTEIENQEMDGRWKRGSFCMHRGDAIETIECGCCGGRKVNITVFACAVHETCTYGNTKAGTDKPHVCLGCDQWNDEHAARQLIGNEEKNG